MGNKHFNGKAWAKCRANKKACKYAGITKAATDSETASPPSGSPSDTVLGVSGVTLSSPTDSTAISPTAIDDSVKNKRVPKWQAAEDLVAVDLSDLLSNYGLTIQTAGGTESNQPDGFIFRDDVLVGGYEVKLIPSVAGIQVVVNEELDKNGQTVFVNANIEKQDMKKIGFADYTLRIANKSLNIGYKVGMGGLDLSDAGHRLTHRKTSMNSVGSCAKCDFLSYAEGTAFEAFEMKYKHNDVILFVGIPDNAGEYRKIAISPNSDDFKQYFVPVLTIRPKASGSSAVPKNAYKALDKALTKVSSYHFKDKKIFVPVENIAEAQTALNKIVGYKLWINKEGQIRKLSNTKNVTALLSLRLRDDLKMKDFSSNAEIVNIILDAEQRKLKTATTKVN